MDDKPEMCKSRRVSDDDRLQLPDSDGGWTREPVALILCSNDPASAKSLLC